MSFLTSPKWWKRNIIVVIAILLIIVLILIGFLFDLPGVRAKTLWDWLQLLIIPFVIVIGGFWFNQVQNTRNKELTTLLAQIASSSTNQAQQLPVAQPSASTDSNLDFWQLFLPYVLVVIGIVVVIFLALHPDSSNQVTSGISAVVGLVGFLAGHTAASAGRDTSEKRLINAMKKTNS